ncbi:hypothetical protein D9611_005682 [Ephemerocybe angulata]|uniref:protein-ribulosamine 3-kinase n=1 Tax=Ephemerocybe angulata TaxID=980116 RepID=A0A8H5F4A8_9AGAR|nr:hypothetical protein D9611_005682 [Tulosesus angulatus]
MRSNSHLSQQLKEQLDKIEPGEDYTGTLPKIYSSSGRTYFVKEGTAGEKEQYAGEAEALKDMEEAAPGLAPHLYAFSTFDDGKPFWIGEYKNIGPLNATAAKVLAKRLATELHQMKSTKGFGYPVPTHCGPTRFENGWYETWENCYSAMYGTLLSRLRETGKYDSLCSTGDKIIERVLPKLLGPLVIQPVLLHGDLWSGNAGVDGNTGEPVIFDPAAFFGHNEADLAIARIFGGFPQSFFDTYFKHNPKSDPQHQFNLRAELYESFHYLNHAVIFGGGGYAMQAEKKMRGLIEAEGEGKMGPVEEKEKAPVFD